MRTILLLLTALLGGCKTITEREQQSLRVKLPPTDLVDPVAEKDQPFITAPDLYAFAEQVRKSKQKTPPEKIYNILAVSGGGAYGAYTAGVLCGWTAAGTRPTFDVCTGISTGGLVAVLAFLGPDYDCDLKRVYTTLRNDDIYKLQRPVRAALFGKSLADNSPLAAQIDAVLTPDTFARIAAAHASGRRLYVGSTNIESKRLVTWDMGAIAAKGTPESRRLFKQVLLATAAIPGFFPPQTIDITVDGRPYQELHVDGGATSAFIVRSPPEATAAQGQHSLNGSNLYVMVAGKLYADQDAVRPKTYTLAANAVSSVLYAITRSQLNEAYSATMLLGMNYHHTAIPQDFEAPLQSTEFDPAKMTAMFDEGYRRTLEKKVWTSKPALLEEMPHMRKRTGTALTPGKPPTQGTATGEQAPTPLMPGGTPPTAK